MWKKWQGKEASMFMALASKYKDPFHAKVLLRLVGVLVGVFGVVDQVRGIDVLTCADRCSSKSIKQFLVRTAYNRVVFTRAPKIHTSFFVLVKMILIYPDDRHRHLRFLSVGFPVQLYPRIKR